MDTKPPDHYQPIYPYWHPGEEPEPYPRVNKEAKSQDPSTPYDSQAAQHSQAPEGQLATASNHQTKITNQRS